MSARVYTFSDALRLTDTRRGHLSRWAERGVIMPDLGGGGSSGSHRKYSFRNIFEIAIATELQQFRVHSSFIEHILTWLRALDPDSVTTGNTPAARAFREFELMSPADRRKKILDINKKFTAHLPTGQRLRFNPYAQVELLEAELHSDEDNDAKRWNAFKSPNTGSDKPGFIVLEIDKLRNAQIPYFVSFVTSLRNIEEEAKERIAFAKVSIEKAKEFVESTGCPVTIIVDARLILERLERATGDSL